MDQTLKSLVAAESKVLELILSALAHIAMCSGTMTHTRVGGVIACVKSMLPLCSGRIC